MWGRDTAYTGFASLAEKPAAARTGFASLALAGWLAGKIYAPVVSLFHFIPMSVAYWRIYLISILDFYF